MKYGIFAQASGGRVSLLEVSDTPVKEQSVGKESMIFSCELIKGGHEMSSLVFKSHFNPSPYVMKLNGKNNWVDYNE